MPDFPPTPRRADPALRPDARVRNLISKKKRVYPLSDYFLEYLGRYTRLCAEGADYDGLLRYAEAVPLYDEHGRDTLWNTVFYGPAEGQEIHDALRLTYALLKSGGDLSTVEHLYVDRVDLCLYGNTLPFRVRIVNALNENFDYFYVKRVDANRVYGLELEHVLSPNRITYLVHGTSLIEEHIVGIPADQFIREAMPTNAFDEIRLAKEFVKFNERCFVRLLGDMHSGNFVIDITPDFEKMQYRMRPIDFDQQSHHGRKQVYLPQFFPQNNPIIELGMRHMTTTTVDQYAREERALIAGRLRASHERYGRLMEVMREDIISEKEHVARLGAQLAHHYDDPAFGEAQTMGELVYASLERLLHHHAPATPSMMPDLAPDPR
ncbi:MAG TPA: hypothetical protein VD962_00160 [Rubricoccaceae bacterium]|nr:hypothetical protein [Rubricoccaceae bacterium]